MNFNTPFICDNCGQVWDRGAGCANYPLFGGGMISHCWDCYQELGRDISDRALVAGFKGSGTTGIIVARDIIVEFHQIRQQLQDARSLRSMR